MAGKMNALRMSREARAQAAVSNRKPMPLTAALYLAQLRPPVPKIPPPGLQQQIAIQIKEQPQMPRVVKIIHIGSI